MDKLQLDLIRFTEPISFDMEVFDRTLESSRGTAKMTDEDIKVCLMNLRGIVNFQQKMIESLTLELINERKRSFLNRLFTK